MRTPVSNWVRVAMQEGHRHTHRDPRRKPPPGLDAKRKSLNSEQTAKKMVESLPPESKVRHCLLFFAMHLTHSSRRASVIIAGSDCWALIRIHPFASGSEPRVPRLPILRRGRQQRRQVYISRPVGRCLPQFCAMLRRSISSCPPLLLLMAVAAAVAAASPHVGRRLNSSAAASSRKLSPHKDDLYPDALQEKLIWEDNFDTLDLKTWDHMVTGWRGGNKEFQYYRNDRRNR